MGNMKARNVSAAAEGRGRAVVAETLECIARHGWQVIGVFPSSGDEGVPFAYTVGLTAKGLPELAIYGLPIDVGHQVLNVVAKRLAEVGQGLTSGQRVDGVLAGGVELVAVDMVNTGDLSMVGAVYGSVVRAVQLCWPDVDGLLPWEQSCRVGDSAQPVFGVVPKGRSVFRATSAPVQSVRELAERIADVPRGALDGADPQADNDRRAGWGARALVGYASHLGQGCLDAELESAATDMLGDLRHLFDAIGLDWDQLADSAATHYRAEILGEL